MEDLANESMNVTYIFVSDQLMVTELYLKALTIPDNKNEMSE